MSMPFYVPPEQMVKDRADFARKGISRGRPIVVVQLDDGILLIGENRSPSLRKIGEVYDRIAFAGVGRFNEFETLRVAGIRYADLKGFSYSREDVTGKGLANAYSQTLGQVFSHEIKPYEVDIIVAELGETRADDSIFRIQFDGTLRDAEGFAVLGAYVDEISAALEGALGEGTTLEQAIALSCAAIEEAGGEPIEAHDWEIALLDRTAGRRTFRRLTTDEITSARS
ncbi:MAG: proteasome subunit alpha [Acidimicrobiia bacterium]|nr:proteasome subunit alpha [Acidimicrobiia bacterium]